jgi:hypothetical protein
MTSKDEGKGLMKYPELVKDADLAKYKSTDLSGGVLLSEDTAYSTSIPQETPGVTSSILDDVLASKIVPTSIGQASVRATEAPIDQSLLSRDEVQGVRLLGWGLPKSVSLNGLFWVFVGMGVYLILLR